MYKVLAYTNLSGKQFIQNKYKLNDKVMNLLFYVNGTSIIYNGQDLQLAKELSDYLNIKLEIINKPFLSPGDIGIIIHWGPSSIPAYDDPKSAKKRKTQNGAEWYKARLLETGKFRPVSGWKETHNYHNTYFQGKDYSFFEKEFKPTNWDPDSWMRIAKSINAKYIILTSKHHDGYCLWPTNNSNGDYGYSNQNLIKQFAESARKFGLLVGIYYSWWEFGKSVSLQYLQNTVIPQIYDIKKEINPDIWWFDGHWNNASNIVNKTIKEIIHNLSTSAIINDRIYGSKHDKEQSRDINYLGDSDFRVYSDRTIPKETPNVPWESIQTIGLSWGYNKAQLPEHYKTGEDLMNLYNQIKNKNGRFLINLGPDSEGNIDSQELKSLSDFSKLLGTL